MQKNRKNIRNNCFKNNIDRKWHEKTKLDPKLKFLAVTILAVGSSFSAEAQENAVEKSFKDFTTTLGAREIQARYSDAFSKGVGIRIGYLKVKNLEIVDSNAVRRNLDTDNMDGYQLELRFTGAGINKDQFAARYFFGLKGQQIKDGENTMYYTGAVLGGGFGWSGQNGLEFGLGGFADIGVLRGEYQETPYKREGLGAGIYVNAYYPVNDNFTVTGGIEYAGLSTGDFERFNNNPVREEVEIQNVVGSMGLNFEF